MPRFSAGVVYLSDTPATLNMHSGISVLVGVMREPGVKAPGSFHGLDLSCYLLRCLLLNRLARCRRRSRPARGIGLFSGLGPDTCSVSYSGATDSSPLLLRSHDVNDLVCRDLQ